MIDLTRFEALVPLDHGLSVVVARRADQTPHTSVVNAGVIRHPLTGDRVVAFVAAGGARKLAHLRVDPTIAVVVRAGWQWAAVEGRAELIGPDDPHPQLDDDGLAVILRAIFSAAGGTHDDWDEYDRVMREERRTAVLVAPTRTSANPGQLRVVDMARGPVFRVARNADAASTLPYVLCADGEAIDVDGCGGRPT